LITVIVLLGASIFVMKSGKKAPVVVR
jgi:hypothetical protein